METRIDNDATIENNGTSTVRNDSNLLHDTVLIASTEVNDLQIELMNPFKTKPSHAVVIPTYDLTLTQVSQTHTVIRHLPNTP